MKIIKYILLLLWYLWCLSSILKNYFHYGFFDWILILILTFLPNIIIWFIAHKANKKKQCNNSIKNNSSTNIPPVGEFPDIKVSESIPTETSTQHIELNNTIYRTDGESISDEEVPYLIQLGYEKALKAEKESPNPKFHRTEREEDLSFNFETKYACEIASLTEKFESLYQEACDTNDLDEKIALLNEAIKAFEKAKKFCYSKGKGGTIYFQDMWEYLHNSKNPCFSYLDIIQTSLEDTIYLKNEVIPKIINTVTQNDGILQKNIYKVLPDIDKSLIQRMIKELESDNIISRVKKGNSYELHILN